MAVPLSWRGVLPIFLCSALSASTGRPDTLAGHAVSRVPHGTVELISETGSIQPGTASAAGLHFRLEPGWHIYWKNPGDSGLPPRLHWELPDGITAGPLLWPIPKRLPIGSLLDYGYEGDVLLPVPLEVAQTVPASGNANLRTSLRVLVCRETCIPGKAELSLNLPVHTAKPVIASQNEGLFAQARANMPEVKPASLENSAEQTANAILLMIRGVNPGATAQFFPDKNGEIQNAAPQKSEPVAGGVKLTLLKATDSRPPISKLDGLLVLSDRGATRAYEISASVSNPPPVGGASGNWSSLIFMVVAAFLGGIVLNVMPCVFPVLSIKALHLMEGARGQYRAIRLGAMAYTAGVLVAFWILIALLLTLRAGGKHLGWGFQLQSPPFVAFLCCLLFLFGLSLAGLFEIGSSMIGLGSGLAHRSGDAGSFFTGVLAVIVATPCTAPFMGTAVGFALSQPAWICSLVFTAMAVGLASPFLLLAFVPLLGRFVPKPGRWMETLKQFLAFPIFATIVWLLWVLGQQVDIDQLATVLLCLLAIAIAGWLLNRWQTNPAVSITSILIIVAASAYPIATLPASASHSEVSTTHAGSLPWEPFSAEKVRQYRSEHKPVLIDFTAAWCVTCQVNDRVVFHSGEVQKEIKDAHVALLRADWTSYDANITQALAQFGRSAVPLYVLYLPDQDQPYVFPDGLLRPSSVISVLEKVKISEANASRRAGV